MLIRKVTESDDMIDYFINTEFAHFALDCNIELNYEGYCFVAENDIGEAIGAITGRVYYNEVHIVDLIIDKDYRRQSIGSALVRTVEDAYRGRGYDKITLTTFGFQAPEFYKKLGYTLEFVRKDEDPKLFKYFYCKAL